MFLSAERDRAQWRKWEVADILRWWLFLNQFLRFRENAFLPNQCQRLFISISFLCFMILCFSTRNWSRSTALKCMKMQPKSFKVNVLCLSLLSLLNIYIEHRELHRRFISGWQWPFLFTSIGQTSLSLSWSNRPHFLWQHWEPGQNLWGGSDVWGKTIDGVRGGFPSQVRLDGFQLLHIQLPNLNLLFVQIKQTSFSVRAFPSLNILEVKFSRRCQAELFWAAEIQPPKPNFLYPMQAALAAGSCWWRGRLSTNGRSSLSDFHQSESEADRHIGREGPSKVTVTWICPKCEICLSHL